MRQMREGPKNNIINFLALAALITPAIWVLLSYAQEQVTITTYYPSPFGVYQELRATFVAIGSNTSMPLPPDNGTLAWGGVNSRGRLKPDNGASIELGGSGTPYIDFSNDMGAGNFDQRIMLVDDNILRINVNNKVLIRNQADPMQRRDIWLRCIRYHWGATTGIICLNNLNVA